MKNDQILETLIKIVKPYVKNEQALKEISSSTRFIEDLKINSARLVDIVLEFEDSFDFSISDEEADKIRTVGSAYDLIKSKTDCKV